MRRVGVGGSRTSPGWRWWVWVRGWWACMRPGLLLVLGVGWWWVVGLHMAGAAASPCTKPQSPMRILLPPSQFGPVYIPAGRHQRQCGAPASMQHGAWPQPAAAQAPLLPGTSGCQLQLAYWQHVDTWAIRIVLTWGADKQCVDTGATSCGSTRGRQAAGQQGGDKQWVDMD